MSKKILGIAGSMKNKNSSSEYLLSVALKAVAEYGIETELVRLNDYRILPCDGCGNCMNGKKCHLLDDPSDQLTEFYNKLLEADGFIFASPVYALSLPAIWKNWIDRCEPCSEEDLAFNYYNYDRVATVKGKALRGKVAGQIVVAAGPGHEWAMASLMQCYTCVKLSVIASAGISLIEYDGQPGIQKNAWSKRVQDADFAEIMARGVGIRVATAIGFSYFDEVAVKRTNQPDDIGDIYVTDADGQEFRMKELTRELPLAVVVGSQQTASDCKALCEKVENILGDRGKCIFVAAVGQLPHFITKEFVKEKIQNIIAKKELYFDWDNDIGTMHKMDGTKPLVYVHTPAYGWRLFAFSEDSGVENGIQKYVNGRNE